LGVTSKSSYIFDAVHDNEAHDYQLILTLSIANVVISSGQDGSEFLK